MRLRPGLRLGLCWVLRGPLCDEGEGMGEEGKGRRGDVDSDALLEQGRRLAKAGPGC